jgi:acetyltransferase
MSHAGHHGTVVDVRIWRSLDDQEPGKPRSVQDCSHRAHFDPSALRTLSAALALKIVKCARRFIIVMSIVRLNDLEWQRHLSLGEGWRIFVRPIKPDDQHLFSELLAHVSKEDLRLRFFDSIKEFSHQFIAKLTDLDYGRAMALAAIDESSGKMLGVVWLYSDSRHETGEYAILLRSNLKGRGLGWALMQLIIEYAKSEGLRRVYGQILQENSVMLKMCRELGFKVKTNAEDRGVCDVTLVLEGQESRDRDAC